MNNTLQSILLSSTNEMSDGKYTDLTVVAADGSKEVFFAIYKATKVANFKRIIAIRTLGRIHSWEDINLFCFNVELKDDDGELGNSQQCDEWSVLTILQTRHWSHITFRMWVKFINYLLHSR